MWFIGYRRQSDADGADAVRIYLECQEKSAAEITCGYVVDVIFPAKGAACRLRGIDGVLALKKFYKLVFSLEERAREHDNDWRLVTESAEQLLQHLRYTRNARDFTGRAEPLRSPADDAKAEPECTPAAKGTSV